jgi:tetratricopeptide (TPR) repeat protein
LSSAEGIDDQRREAEAWVDHAEGKNEAAINLLREVADGENGVLEASAGIPAREMLADLLLEMGRSEPALTEYEADLEKNPNRFDALYGAAQAAELSGKGDKANRYYAQLVRACNGSNSNRPELGQARARLASKGSEIGSASHK